MTLKLLKLLVILANQLLISLVLHSGAPELIQPALLLHRSLPQLFDSLPGVRPFHLDSADAPLLQLQRLLPLVHQRQVR